MIWILRTLALASCLVVGLTVTSCGGDEDTDTEDSSGPMATGSDCNCGLCYCAGLNCPPAPACCETDCAPADGGTTVDADGGMSPLRPSVGGGGPGREPVTIDCAGGRDSENDIQCRNRCESHCEEGEARDDCMNACCTRHSDYTECFGCCVDALGVRVNAGSCRNLCQQFMR